MSETIQPQRAPVKPRTYIPELKGCVSIEDEVLSLVRQGRTGLVAITGPAGSGKTTALRHLAYVLQDEAGIYFDSLSDHDELLHRAASELVVYGNQSPYPRIHMAKFTLAPWSSDDFIEYLLAEHRSQCTSVMKRVALLEDPGALHGLPLLWRVVLDEMATDENIFDAGFALRRQITRELPPDDFETARLSSLAELVLDDMYLASTRLHERDKAVQFLAKASRKVIEHTKNFTCSLLAHEFVRLTLAAEYLSECLQQKRPEPFLAFQLPYELVSAVARILENDREAHMQLTGIASLQDSPLSAMAASILHAAGMGLQPNAEKPARLNGAYLPGVKWPGAQCSEIQLRYALLNEADLHEARLNKAKMTGASLERANLVEASLENAVFNKSDLTNADLSFSKATFANFVQSDLKGAKFRHANLNQANFLNADLRGASFEHADLSRALLNRAKLQGADFSHANLQMAQLVRQMLRETIFRGTRFSQADLSESDLEGMSLPGVDFEGAKLIGARLTATLIPHANFRNADLRNTGLAHVSWERADLRGVNLTGATFHMGNSRSGLVFSPIAMEGSKTGFYTDEFTEQGFKAPEQIRKANLRCADLRGAKFEGVDFYLVDLRDALLDEEQRTYLRGCGAILEHRVA
ncbi:MAG: pentapeptide repeat-containing protein [Planctomycetes bacterium]|nr:pentapeptide repeat-containing protein [Planctomycetota bacterium]